MAIISTTLVIFGSTGDLARTKLFPSLYHLDKNGFLPDIFNIVAVGRKDLKLEEYLSELEKEVLVNYKSTYAKAIWERFTSKISYLKGSLNDTATYEKLAEKLTELDTNRKTCSYKIFYMAVSPDLFETVANGIKHTELNQTCFSGKSTKLIVEKPFGRSLTSFEKLNTTLLSLFDEKQIYRLDHLLGKETVQNILFFRLANTLLDPNLDANLIESLEIKYLESNGVGTRGAYFDNYGQLRDMLQSHMLQLFATTFMDIPEPIDAEHLAQAKTKLINSLQVKNVLRAQYTSGVILGKKVVGYLEEKNISKDSKTETLVKVEAVVTDGTLKNKKVTFITGKALSSKLTEVVVNYKVLHSFKNYPSANKLIFRIQPEEGITLVIKVKKPGQEELEDVNMSFKFKENFAGILGDAYEAIMLDIITDKNLFSISTQELVASWKFVDPILKKWEQDPSTLETYAAGSDELLT